MDPDDLAIALARAKTDKSDQAGGSSSETNLAIHPNLPLPSILKPPRGTNQSGYKYKYPEAAPTPEGEDDDEWNKVYTAADSRFYNKHGKSSQASKKYRQSGETYELAVTMIADKKQKARNDYNSQAAELTGGGGGSGGAAILPPKTTTPKPKAPTKKVQPPPSLKQELSTSSRDETPGVDKMPLSISEQIKQEGRPRKAPSAAPSSHQGTPAPSTASKVDSPPAKIEKPPPPKAGVKKKGTAAVVRKPTKQSQENKVSKSAGKSTSPRPAQSHLVSSDSESNDGGEYCVCRGPDDHRMMVNCEGGCNEWYHCSCIGMDVEDAKELLDRYICPKCKSAELFTTWKRMCRYNNVGEHLNLRDPCRRAARVTEDPPSKYCSDEHRLAFMEFIRDHMARQDNAPSMGGKLNVQEVAEILTHVKSNAELQSLGKKPRLPIPEGADPTRPIGLDYITPEEEEEIKTLELKKQKIQTQIEGYRNQQKLLVMIHERAQAAAKHPSVDEKAVCGYDNRLAFNEHEFAHWLSTPEGQTAFETQKLGPRTDESKTIGARNHSQYKKQTMKSCARHKGWRLIHGQDYAAMTAYLQREWERCERKKGEVIDDAETREAAREYHAHNTVEQLF
ncbi:Set1 complex component [Lachnellula subtilissima]|uniref:Set1 complex component n=1 Tax=Lachnellula subtilissima TaxID=602034 RepID=A0A8H8RQZ9_9HELO|nr:Set1 complex component [Lachnellula subtilissima]